MTGEVRRTELRSPWLNKPGLDDVVNLTIQDMDQEYALMALLMSPWPVIRTWLMEHGFLAKEVSIKYSIFINCKLFRKYMVVHTY